MYLYTLKHCTKHKNFPVNFKEFPHIKRLNECRNDSSAVEFWPQVLSALAWFTKCRYGLKNSQFKANQYVKQASLVIEYA
jgi:hypothetical protein